MKIAFVYDAVYPWIKGGAEKRIYELGKRLAERGNEVHVFGVKWWKGASVIKYENMVLHGVCSPMELYINGRRSISEALIFSIKLFPYLINRNFDIIDVGAFPYFSCFSIKLISILKKIPMVITWLEIWGNYWYEYLGYLGFLGKLVERLASKLTPYSFAISVSTRKDVELLGIGSENIHIVPGGIDIKRIEIVQPTIDKCDLIFVGRLIREKNVDVLLEAVYHIKKTLQDVKCHIIGDGPEKDRLARYALELKIQESIKFFGFMDYDDVISHLKSSKVLVLPSSREGFGMIVIEAFACGVPVVTVNEPRNAASLLVNEETGFVVDLDGKKLGQAILSLILNDALRKKLSACAMDHAQEYDWDSIVCRLVCLYEQIIKAK